MFFTLGSNRIMQKISLQYCNVFFLGASLASGTVVAEPVVDAPLASEVLVKPENVLAEKAEKQEVDGKKAVIEIWVHKPTNPVLEVFRELKNSETEAEEHKKFLDRALTQTKKEVTRTLAVLRVSEENTNKKYDEDDAALAVKISDLCTQLKSITADKENQEKLKETLEQSRQANAKKLAEDKAQEHAKQHAAERAFETGINQGQEAVRQINTKLKDSLALEYKTCSNKGQTTSECTRNLRQQYKALLSSEDFDRMLELLEEAAKKYEEEAREARKKKMNDLEKEKETLEEEIASEQSWGNLKGGLGFISGAAVSVLGTALLKSYGRL